jgi:hypothetical protein
MQFVYAISNSPYLSCPASSTNFPTGDSKKLIIDLRPV